MPYYRKTGLFFSSLGFLLALICLVSDFWLVNKDVPVHSGLWNICINEYCRPVPAGKGYNDSTRAFMIISILAGVLSIFSIGITFSSHTSAKHLGSITAVFSSISAVMFLMFALAVFTGETIDAVLHELSPAEYGWSFYLGWMALLSLCITELLHLYAYQNSAVAGYEVIEPSEFQDCLHLASPHSRIPYLGSFIQCEL